MRYGDPSISEVLSQIMANECERLLVVPMFPQYSATTTASGFDKLFECLSNLRVMPSVRLIRDYHKDAGYIRSVASTIHDQLRTIDSATEAPEYNLISFHGIPATYIQRGDIYQKQCYATAELLANQMGWPKEKWQTCFQSRLGRQEWLTPYTDETLKELAARGMKRVLIVQPGFTADCLETIDEIGNEGSHDFTSAGGETLIRVPCVNDHPDFISALADIVSRESRGWGS